MLDVVTTNAHGRNRNALQGVDVFDVDCISGVSLFGGYGVLGSAWTAKDPIGFGGGTTNLYEYAGNDTVNRSDPTGLASFTYEGTSFASGGGLGRFDPNITFSAACSPIGADSAELAFSVSYGGTVTLGDKAGADEACHELNHAEREYDAIRRTKDILELFEGTHSIEECRDLASLLKLEFWTRVSAGHLDGIYATNIGPPTDGATGSGYPP